MIQCMFFFFNDTATTEIYTLSLHDALPIFSAAAVDPSGKPRADRGGQVTRGAGGGIALRRRASRYGLPTRHRDRDRKSTRLNSSHANISYSVFCLKKKKHTTEISTHHTS